MFRVECGEEEAPWYGWCFQYSGKIGQRPVSMVYCRWCFLALPLHRYSRRYALYSPTYVSVPLSKQVYAVDEEAWSAGVR